MGLFVALAGVWSQTASSFLVWTKFWWMVRWSWVWSTAILRVVAWWTVVCGFVLWPVWCVLAGHATVSSVCWMGSPWAASMVDVPVSLLWSGVAYVQVMTTGATMFAVSRLWSLLVSSFSVFPVVFRTWYGVMISVCLVAWHQCSWRGYFVRAVHDNMSIFITFMTSDVRVV